MRRERALSTLTRIFSGERGPVVGSATRHGNRDAMGASSAAVIIRDGRERNGTVAVRRSADVRANGSGDDQQLMGFSEVGSAKWPRCADSTLLLVSELMSSTAGGPARVAALPSSRNTVPRLSVECASIPGIVRTISPLSLFKYIQ